MLNKYHGSEPALHINEINVYDKYKFMECIGKGSYGEVWLVLPKKPSPHKSFRRQNVLKRLDLRQTLAADVEAAEREAKLLSTLEHPNIVAYTESFRSNDGFLNIVMAYCEGGDLYTRLKEKKKKKEPLAEDQIIEWFIQICMALQYIHEKNILHRDLKTQNIFLTKNEIVKVGDLGIARVLDSETDLAKTVIGTPFYMSPEIFLSQPYGQKSDIWSLGICVYEMTTFEHAFAAENVNRLALKITREQTPQISKVYSRPLREIITSMLRKEPDSRPTAKSILQSKFIKEHILRLLKKAQAKCQKPTQVNSQPIVTVSPVSSPSRPASGASNSVAPRNRLSNHNHSTPVLPSYPLLPSSHSRPSSSIENNRSAPVVEPSPSNESFYSDSRVRRRLQARRSSPLPSVNNDEKDLRFLSNVSHNDTLQRIRRHRSAQQHQQRSSSDEQDQSPNRFSSREKSRPAESAESNANASRPPQAARVTKSYDLNQGANSSARQRRRESKLLSSSNEYLTANDSPSQTVKPAELSQANSQENLNEEIEKKKEGEKDMNDFVFQLTATLQLPILQVLDPNQLRDNERTICSAALQETRYLHQRCQQLRENCLQEISPSKLKRVLKILENVDNTDVEEEIIIELGQALFNKYGALIFALRFYEDDLLRHA